MFKIELKMEVSSQPIPVLVIWLVGDGWFTIQIYVEHKINQIPLKRAAHQLKPFIKTRMLFLRVQSLRD